MAVFGHYDPDPTKPAHEKVQDVVEMYRARFGSEPTVVQTSAPDADEVRASVGALPVPVEARTDIQRHIYYAGREDA